MLGVKLLVVIKAVNFSLEQYLQTRACWYLQIWNLTFTGILAELVPTEAVLVLATMSNFISKLTVYPANC